MYRKIGELIRKIVAARYFGLFLAGALGGLFFLILFWEIFLPSHLQWIFTGGLDSFKPQIGWEFFRQSPWSWPLGVIKDLNYPTGVSLTYNDSIPLLAFVFKAISWFLPPVFQYLGIWLFACFVLQGVFGYLLTSLIKRDVIIDLIGSCFFILSPILMFRVVSHASLVGHFLILWAIYLLLRKSSSFQIWQWGIIFVLSILIHPYFLFIIAPLWMADQIIKIKRNGIIRQGFLNFVMLGSVCFVAYASGLFYTDKTGDGGFGEFSMNLNALFNPASNPGSWSRLLPVLSQQPLQYEGFNYLGAGILLLFLISAISFILYGRERIGFLFKKYWPVLLAVIVLSAVALSNKIYFGNYLVLSFNLSKFWADVFSLVRSSGRMFWPVYYLLLLFSLCLVCYLRKKLVVVILCFALLFQVYDFSEVFAQKHFTYSNAPNTFLSDNVYWGKALSLSFWKTLPRNYKRIYITPSNNLAASFEYLEFYGPIALFAAENKMTINTGYFNRDPKYVEADFQKQIILLKEGKFDPQTVYIFLDDPNKHILINALPSDGVLANIDGYKIFLLDKDNFYKKYFVSMVDDMFKNDHYLFSPENKKISLKDNIYIRYFHPDLVWTNANGSGYLGHFSLKLDGTDKYLKLNTYGWNPFYKDLDKLGLGVSANDVYLQYVCRVDKSFYFQLSVGMEEINNVWIDSNTFVPKDVGVNEDSRTLGVDVDSVEIVSDLDIAKCNR